jgi:hypothetical protein
MNIFAVDLDPKFAAYGLCDQHIVKMPLETAQMLSTNLSLWGLEHEYKPCFHNHPCTIWARQSYLNFMWLWYHGASLCYTYTLRYKKVHKCEKIIKNALKSLQNGLKKGLVEFPAKGLTPFAQAMPEQFKQENAVEAYRSYYKGAKLAFARWKHSEKPAWLR